MANSDRFRCMVESSPKTGIAFNYSLKSSVAAAPSRLYSRQSIVHKGKLSDAIADRLRRLYRWFSR